MKTILIYIGVLFLTACSTIGPTPNVTTPENADVKVTIAEPDRIRFSGKGAGAGMMMMSSMGSMGIAIGVAIDEGIAKEIQASADQEGFDIEAIIKNAFTQGKPISVHVERYGFVSQAGENDPSTAQLVLVVTDTGGDKKTIKYPEIVKQSKTVPLEELKKNGELAVTLMKEASMQIAKIYFK